MNDVTEASLWPQLNDTSLQQDRNDDVKILNNDSIPGPVKNTWSKIKDKELYIIQQNNNRSVYVNDYQLKDAKIEVKNFINYTWEDLQNYGLSSDILELFKKRLERLYLKI